MPFFLVRRSELEAVQRELRQARAHAREAKHRAIAAESAAEVLRHQLDRSETERTDINLKLIRVGFGINPFTDPLTETSVQPAPTPDAEPDFPQMLATASHEEIQTTFVRQAAEQFGNNLPKIARFVEKKMAQYYAQRDAPQLVTQQEMDQAAKVAADLERAMDEGAREARKE